jgi:superfamily II DNA or RNA helicase
MPEAVSAARLHATLRALGRAGLGLPPESGASVAFAGAIPLHPHQQEAVDRLRPLLARHGGALLADAVGLGKTYVALALAPHYDRTHVIAPAGLVPMWREAVQRAFGDRRIVVQSLHRFSRAQVAPRADTGDRQLVIVDEAHHLRTPHTKRYAGVAEWCRRAHVLLLSASPVYNRTADLAHLFALFLGARAQTLTATELHRLTVRRTAQELATPVSTPRLVAHAPLAVPDAPSVTQALARIPPPIATRDGVAAGALVTLGLVRAWCSSAAACLALLRRRKQRADVLDDILATGRWPSRDELRSWTITDDAVQLGFTSLLVAAPTDSGDHEDRPPRIAHAREHLAHHRDALISLDILVRAVADRMDRVRVDHLRQLRGLHRGITMIAFSQYAETVRGLGRQLRWEAGVATLTSSGGRVAGGAVSRTEVLHRVAPRAHGVAEPPAHERVRLLLTTDLLAEGVNLQDAGVVVHLDQPWTPAAIAQREGRITRIGSHHPVVHAYTMRPPGGGATLLSIAARLQRKARAAMVVLTPDVPARPSLQLMPRTEGISPLQQWLQQWATHAPAPASASAPAIGRRAAVVLPHAGRPGWLAAAHDGAQWHLCGGWFVGHQRRTRVSRDPRVLRALVEQVVRTLEHAAQLRARSSVSLSDADAPASDEWTAARAAERTVRAVLRRQRARAGTRAVVDVLQAPAHLAARRLRELTAQATLRDRLVLAPLVAEAARRLRSVRGIGDERALAALLAPTVAPAAGAPVATVQQWLQSLIALGSDAPPDATATHHETEPPALLLFLP